MEQIVKSETRVQHLAGIVPIAAPPLDFNMPWHDAMMPIGPNYLAVERAVYECLLAGCKTIWIVCHMGTQPLLRKRIGDTVFQPYPSFQREIAMDPVAERANVFYVPIHPRDRDRRDCLSWSVLYGANSAYRLCKFISKWVIPEKFYCAFPYGITDDQFIINNKPNFIKPMQKEIVSYGGKTVRDGYYTSFTFNASDFKKCRNFIRSYSFNMWNSEERKRPDPKEALTLTVEQVFKNLDIDEFTVLECPWFYNIDNWSDYRKFLSSGIVVKKNEKSFSKTNYRESAYNAIENRRREADSKFESDEEGV